MVEREKGKGVASEDDGRPAGEVETLLSKQLRRWLVAGKRGGPCTPFPAWKLADDAGEGADVGSGCRRPSVSARKLGANLWDVQEILPLEEMSGRSGRPHLRDGRAADLSDFVEGDRVTSYNPAVSSATSLYLKGGIGDAGSNLKASTELLKVLNRIWSLEEKNASNVSVIKSLKAELEHARARILELVQAQKGYCSEMDELMSKVAGDKALRKKKEEDRVKSVVRSIREELDDEKRLRRRSESLHRKLGKELADTKTALSKALKDLENQRTSNGLLQNLCDEFASGIVQQEKGMREFKKQTKGCEHKVDGLLLHISEVWLDERLQMQMAESCGEKPEEGAIISRLKEEILPFFQARQASCKNSNGEHHHHHHNLRRQSLESLHLNGTVSAPHDIEDDDSITSGLHCFELNMDKAKEGIRDQSKSGSVRKVAGIQRAKGLDRHLEGIEFGNTMNLQADADSNEAAIFHKLSNSTSGGGLERNVRDVEGSNLLKDSLKSSSVSKAHHLNYQGEINQNKFSASESFFTSSSPFQQWNYQGVSADPELSECSPKLPQGLKESTLKAKLLEARLEGYYARLRAWKDA